MFRKVAAFELRHQLGSPVFWVAFGIFFLLAFAAITNPNIHSGSRGNTNYNAPIAIIRTTRVSKTDYLVGRFTGAFIASMVMFAAVPLARVENQGCIHHYKGAVAMYRLKQTVGEETINRALRRMLAEYAFKPTPHPKSTDFLAFLRQEAGPQYDGKYDVALDVEAHKFYADSKGRETEAPMNEAVDVGAFLAEPGKKDFDKSKILTMGHQIVTSGKRTLHLVTLKPPAFAGIDPFNEWVDRNSDDNVKAAVGK